MNDQVITIKQESYQLVNQWIESCTRGGKISRNTVAIGIVVFDHLRRECPLTKESVLAPGGEIKGARSGLRSVLESYGISTTYLKEVTSRQAHQDGQKLLEMFDWGEKLGILSPENRDEVLLELIGILRNHADAWFEQQKLNLHIDHRESPATWVRSIVENAKGRSGGIVEQHLVGAKLERRFKFLTVPNYPAHAGDLQTARTGDFTIAQLVYHVTATPSRNVIQKCAENIRLGLHPILLVPGEQEYRALALAQDEAIERELTIISIESFVAVNIIELSTEEHKDFFSILREIVDIYNRRLAEVETNLSLHIEID